MDARLVQSFHSQKGLPIEIIHIILIYMRQPQPTFLLRDILNFTQSLPYIIQAYKWKWGNNENQMLENDLFKFGNNYILTWIGIQPKFLDILRRFSNYKFMDRLCLHIFCFGTKLTVKTRVFIIWGLLTVEERLDFIRTFIKRHPNFKC